MRPYPTQAHVCATLSRKNPALILDIYFCLIPYCSERMKKRLVSLRSLPLRQLVDPEAYMFRTIQSLSRPPTYAPSADARLSVVSHRAYVFPCFHAPIYDFLWMERLLRDRIQKYAGQNNPLVSIRTAAHVFIQICLEIPDHFRYILCHN